MKDHAKHSTYFKYLYTISNDEQAFLALLSLVLKLLHEQTIINHHALNPIWLLPVNYLEDIEGFRALTTCF